jgi:hypothetical protein
MSLRSAGFYTGLLLAGCALHHGSPPDGTAAGPPETAWAASAPSGTAQRAAASPKPALPTRRGVILAMRPVPVAGTAARLLLAGFDHAARTAVADPAEPAGVEIIVRTNGGTLLSIVQPAAPGLHAGEPVRLVHGPLLAVAPAEAH